MKLLTLNTHSWQETDQFEKLDILVKAISEQAFDLVALQEVNQVKNSNKIAPKIDSNKAVRETNFAYLLQKKLAEVGFLYEYTWDFVHDSYEDYQEGLSFLSRFPIKQKSVIDLNDDYDDTFWKHRRAVKIALEINQQDIYFINCHCGWWNDKEVSFKTQFNRISENTSNALTFLLGDFNNASHEKNQGYDFVLNKGWFDTFVLSGQKEKGETVIKKIDGWEDNTEKLRIDYIFINKPLKVKTHTTIFNNDFYPVISDHFGIVLDVEL